MRGRVDEARALIAETRAVCADRGERFEVAVFTGDHAAEIELLAGDPAAAAELAADGCDQLERLGDYYFRSPMVARLAQLLCILGRLDEADAAVDSAKRLAAGDHDAQPSDRWRQARAVVLARRGRHAEAEELARAAVAMAETTSSDLAAAYANLADVLALAGRPTRRPTGFTQPSTATSARETSS